MILNVILLKEIVCVNTKIINHTHHQIKANCGNGMEESGVLHTHTVFNNTRGQSTLLVAHEYSCTCVLLSRNVFHFCKGQTKQVKKANIHKYFNKQD